MSNSPIIVSSSPSDNGFCAFKLNSRPMSRTMRRLTDEYLELNMKMVNGWSTASDEEKLELEVERKILEVKMRKRRIYLNWL